MENTWVFPVVEALHLLGMALLLGPVLLSDLGALGVIPTVPDPGFSKIALALVVVTGMSLFLSNSGRYLSNPAFLIKLSLLILAGLWRRRGLLSLTLWSLVILASRAVIDFDA